MANVMLEKRTYKNEFTIMQKLPSLNDYILANRSNIYMGAKFKKEVENAISKYIKIGIASKTLRKVKGLVEIKFEWTEKNKKRDLDNIVSAKKFILDVLVKNGVLEDDSQKYVIGFNDILKYGNKHSVKVELNEVEQ